MSEKQELNAGEVLTWWTRNKKKVVPLVLVIIGLLGGNVDRAGTFLNEALPEHIPSKFEKKLDKIIEIQGKQNELLSGLVEHAKNN